MRIKETLWLILFLALSALLWPANPFDLSKLEVRIPKGASVKMVEKILKEQKIISHYSIFRWVIKVFGLEKKIKAGEYLFSPSDSLPKVVCKLAAGEIIPARQIKVTFPEGTSIYKMGMILKANGYLNWKEFQNLVNEGVTMELRERHKRIFKYIPSESLEGYLFPDTYCLFADASVEAIVETMVNRFEEVVLPFWDKASKDTKFSLHEILTLASIIEKEAQKSEERPIISSVYHNRLKAGMPLAADPTIKYALEKPTKVVYLDQLSVRSLYNTYRQKGLPPGPICNPGIESIKAAVYPAKTNFFFFVAKPDGGHIFSRTWSEHQKAKAEISTMKKDKSPLTCPSI
ncbi:MAG: endolytic transglycosylase MltG [Candidatus Margulisiibacteriota bacterium]